MFVRPRADHMHMQRCRALCMQDALSSIWLCCDRRHVRTDTLSTDHSACTYHDLNFY